MKVVKGASFNYKINKYWDINKQTKTQQKPN